MLTIYTLVKSIVALGKDVTIQPTEDTILGALQDKQHNPAHLDLITQGMVPFSSLTSFVNPEHMEQVKKIPSWLTEFAYNQAGNAGNDNSEKYSIFMQELVSNFPGYSNDESNTVAKHTFLCEQSQVKTCPEGYKKVYLDNFRPRSLDELKSLLSKKSKDRLDGKKSTMSNKEAKTSETKEE